MNCANHADASAVAYCRTCGKALCANCTRPVRGVIYCEDCLGAKMEGTVPPASAGFVSGTVPAAASGQLPPPPPPGSGSGPNPTVAGILAGFFPLPDPSIHDSCPDFGTGGRYCAGGSGRRLEAKHRQDFPFRQPACTPHPYRGWEVPRHVGGLYASELHRAVPQRFTQRVVRVPQRHVLGGWAQHQRSSPAAARKLRSVSEGR